jgi:adenylate cyclase
MSIFNELKRRNVLRVVTAYVVAAWFIIQVVETIFPIYGLSDASVRVIITLLAIGLLPAAIFAWIYELTPDGIKLEKDVDRSSSTTSKTGKTLDRIVMVVLALGMTLFAVDKFVLAPERQAQEVVTATATARQEGRMEGLIESYGETSIAVLAFADMSPAGDQEYFSDGIAEEMLNLLAKIPELRVISRTSAFAFKGKNIEIPEIARRLNVGHILEGSVRKSGNQIRITVQLIEALTDTHLWSETYDRPLNNVFAIQDEIAAEVVQQLQVTLLGAVPTVEETDPEAYALFLQAKQQRGRQTAESLDSAVVLYLKAIAMDANYAAAWKGLATVYCDQANFDTRSMEDLYELCRDANQQALKIDPDYAQAHVGLGWVATYHDSDLVAAAKHFQRALALEPTNFTVLGNSTVLLRALGRPEKLIAISKYLVRRDPANPIAYDSLGQHYAIEGRFDEAVTAFTNAVLLAPDMLGAHYNRGSALLFNGEAQSALEDFLQDTDEEYRIKGSAMALYTLGRHAEYEAALTELKERWGEQWPSEVAQVYAWVGDHDSAFQWLEKGYEQTGSREWADIASDYLLAILHDDPRWIPFLEKIGKSPAQLATIEFDVLVPH